MWIGVLVHERQGCRKPTHTEHLGGDLHSYSTYAIHGFLTLESWSRSEDVSIILRRAEGCRRRHCRTAPSLGGHVGCGGMGRF